MHGHHIQLEIAIVNITSKEMLEQELHLAIDSLKPWINASDYLGQHGFWLPRHCQSRVHCLADPGTI